MDIKIREFKSTSDLIMNSIKARQIREETLYKEIINSYQKIAERDNREGVGGSALGKYRSSTEYSTASKDSELASKLNTELREVYKLAESYDKINHLNERLADLDTQNRTMKKAAKILEEEKSKFEKESEEKHIVINELIEKVEIKSRENSGLKKENEMLTELLKEKEENYAALFKKYWEYESQIVDKLNQATEIANEAQQMKIENMQKKYGEEESQTTAYKGIDYGDLKMDYFNVPSRPKHNLFAHNKEATCLSYSTQGAAVATGGGDGRIKLWDVESGKEIGSFNKQKKAISTIAFTPDDLYLVSCSLDRSIKVWKISTMREAITFSGHSDTINSCKVNYATKCLITGSSDRTIRLWDYGKGHAIKTFPCVSSWFAVDSLPAETEIVSGHLDGSLRFWCAKNEEKIHEMKDIHTDAITSVTMTLDGNYVLTNSRDHWIKMIDIRKYEEVSSFEHDMYINGSNTNRAGIASNAKYGSVGSRSGNMILFEVKDGSLDIEEIYTDVHASAINAVEWQPGACSFSSIDSMGSLIIWE